MEEKFLINIKIDKIQLHFIRILFIRLSVEAFYFVDTLFLRRQMLRTISPVLILLNIRTAS